MKKKEQRIFDLESYDYFEGFKNEASLFEILKESFIKQIEILEANSKELTNYAAIAFPEEYGIETYATDPEFFVHEMVALFVWKIADETTLPDRFEEEVYYKIIKFMLRRFGIKINEKDNVPDVWLNNFSNVHVIIKEAQKIDNRLTRPTSIKGYDVDHSKKCNLDEASDLLIAAQMNDLENENKIKDIVSDCMIEIGKILLKSIKSSLPIRKERIMQKIKAGLNDNPSKLYKFIKEKKAKVLSEVLDEINKLVGLDLVKRNITDLIKFQKVQGMREKEGLKAPPISRHLVFTGNPGTGKTTIARMLGEAYKAIGILKKGHFVETDRSGLVAGYIGQTAIKTKEVCHSALGGILFIDEAYSLAARGENDFGKEAINFLLKFMEDNRNDIVVIVAGYSKEMSNCIEINPGLKSRFGKTIEFPDYSPSELLDIFKMLCISNDYLYDKSVEKFMEEFFYQKHFFKAKNFSNARAVRNVFERAVEYQSNRLATMEDIRSHDLKCILLDDVANVRAEVEISKKTVKLLM